MSVHILYVEGVLGARFDEFIIDNTYKLEGGGNKESILTYKSYIL